MPPHIFVVMSIYHPHTEYLRAQIDSVLAQEDVTVTLLCVPDGPDAGEFEYRADPRIVVQRQSARAGITANFLRGLAGALALSRGPADLFAFCDQDDVWAPRKLSTLAAALRGGAVMAYCDARVIDADGRELAPSLFALERRRPHRRLTDLLIVNNVSGMSMLFTRACALRAVRQDPPGRDPELLHDWWLALIARLSGDTVFVDEPLLDYRRHGDNAVGPALADDRPAKRTFMSSAYIDMCAQGYHLRQRLRESLAQIAAAEGLSAPPDLPRLGALARHLVPPGSQRARAAMRLIIAMLRRHA